MQVYDGLPILTAQPSPEDKEKCPHALYGVLHPNDPCSAGNWREMAQAVIVQALAEGRVPIVCGGSGLYINALLRGLSPIPDIPAAVRAATVARYEALGAKAFFSELERRDPIMAARFHAGHTARILRAMEVLDFTGQSLAQWQTLPPLAPPADWVFAITLIMPDRSTLYARCNTRFEQMLENGGWEEVAAFDSALAAGRLSESSPLTHALGVQPLRQYLHGALPRDEAVAKGQAETRHYAKRQVTWFRHQVKQEKNVANLSILP